MERANETRRMVLDRSNDLFRSNPVLMSWPATELFSTPNLSLEPISIDHVGEMVIVLASPDLYVFTGGEPPTSGVLERRYLAQSRGESPDGLAGWNNWAIRSTSTKTLIGYVQATVTVSETAIEDATGALDDAATGAATDAVTAPATQERNPKNGPGGTQAEIAWVITPAAQGKGYAQEATAAMMRWLRHQGVRRFVAHIHPLHEASKAVARRNGLSVTAVVIDGEARWESRV